MAAKIPTFADLSFNDPRAVTPGVRFPASDPVAEAQGRLGQGLQQLGGAALKVADYQEDKRQALNEATATTDFVNRLIPLHTQISLEHDPAQIAQLRRQYDSMLQTSAQAIDDPGRKARFIASHSRTLLQANADADERLALLGRQNAAVGIERQLDQLATNGARDQRTFDIALLGGKQLLESASNAGLSPEWVYQREKRFSGQLITGRVNSLIEQGDAEGAKALLDRHPNEIDPVHADVLRRRAEAKGVSVTGDALANWSLGLGPEPAARPSVIAPAGRHINFGATGALGDPREPGWAEKNITAVSSPSGAKFSVNKAAAADFEGFLHDLEATGYKINPEESGGYNLRDMTGKPGTLSEHAYGVSIDINPSRNPYSKEGKKITDLPGNVASLAEKHNLEWGGNWTSPVDPMHFQWRGPRNRQEAGTRLASASTLADVGAGTGAGHIAPKAERVAFAREYAASKGINPDAVQATMAGEGLNEYTGDGGTSFGDFQLHAGGGMGDLAEAAGIDIRDPSTWKDQARFAIDQMAANRDKGAEWYAGQWHGAPAWAARSFSAPSSGPNAGMAAAEIPEMPAEVRHAPPPNRSGLPTLQETWSRIWGSQQSDAVKAHAWQTAVTRYNAFEADATRAERVAAQQRLAQDEQIEGEIIADAASATPRWTAQSVMADPRLSPEARMRMVTFLSGVSRKTGDRDTNTYGSGFYDAFQAIHLPDGDPRKITSPDQLYSRVGPNGDLTIAGLEKLRTELISRRTPEGEAAAAMKKQFLDGAHKMISGADPLLHIRDPKGEEQYLKFLAQVLPAYEEGLGKGKSPAMMLNPDSPDYLGKIIPQFRRTPEQMAADMLGDAAPPPAASKNPADYKTPQDLIRAVQSGAVPYEAGVAEARRRGYIPATPSVPIR